MPVVVGEESFITQTISKSISYYYAIPTTEEEETADDETAFPTEPQFPYSPSTSPLISPVTPAPSSSPASPAKPHRSSCSDSPVLPLPSPSSSHRPLLLLFPWLHAKPAAVAKYRALYLCRGMDVLSVESSLWHFLWPPWGLEYAAQVLELLMEPCFTGRHIVVHAFSIGGYMFTQMLIHMDKDPERYMELSQMVKGHVYDSLVVGSLEHMAIGLGKSLFPRFDGLAQGVVAVAMLYFWLFKTKTADLYDRSIRVFHSSPVTSPALFFFCENDLMCDSVNMEATIHLWRKRGIAVEARKWKESVHTAHLRCHPEEYLSTLDTFLNSLAIAPLREKI